MTARTLALCLAIATGAATASPPVAPPKPTLLQTAKLRCNGRPLAARPPSWTGRDRKESTLDGMMPVLARLREAGVRVELRRCGPYRTLTITNRHQSENLIYADTGALVAAIASSDVVDPRCGSDPESAAIHYGRQVDCVYSKT